MRGRGIHGKPRRTHLAAVTNGRLTRASMNPRRVTHAAIVQNLVAARGAALETVGDIESENRRELFHRKRIFPAYAGDIGHQTASSRRDAKARHLSDDFD